MMQIASRPAALEDERLISVLLALELVVAIDP